MECWYAVLENEKGQFVEIQCDNKDNAVKVAILEVKEDNEVIAAYAWKGNEDGPSYQFDAAMKVYKS